MKSSNSDPKKPVAAPSNGNKARTARTRDRAGKKQALIDAALKLFASKGYDATTTREIAACAGCAEGLIHRYFSSKAGLLPALMELPCLARSGGPAPPSPPRRLFRR